jgi:hypothetical protein
VGFRLLAYTAAGLHYLFLAFGVFGGFLAWRWRRLIWLQVAAAAWLLVIVIFRLYCPLTWVEDRARERAGMAPKPGGFITNYVEGVIFPEGWRTAATVVAALVVLVSWAGFRARRRKSSTVRRPGRGA